MSTQVWIGNPKSAEIAALFATVDLPSPQHVVWLSGSHDQPLDQGGLSDLHVGKSASALSLAVTSTLSSVKATSSPLREIRVEPVGANFGDLEGCGRILDALRQREPQQLVIWLPAMALSPGSSQSNVPDLALVNTWTTRLSAVVSAALELMAQRSDAQILIVFPEPDQIEDSTTAETRAAIAYVREWVAASQSRANVLGVALALVRQPVADS